MKLGRKLHGAYARRMAKWLGRRPFVVSPPQPIVSFTFDDFPRSALSIGGAILEHNGARGTFYTAFGLESQTIATGEMFHLSQIAELITRGHELGCHTYHHHPAWETPTPVYLASVERNHVSLADHTPLKRFQTHSYPISYPRPGTKRRLQSRFRGCRAGGQAPNRGTVDLNYLNSFFLEQSVDDFTAVERVIGANAEQGGWLIFSTHDLSEAPTRFGCTPRFFEATVLAAARSGARIEMVSSALDAIGAP